jgi:predicted kinase
MFNVCSSCGMYAVEKEIHPGGGWRAEAACPNCGHLHPFLRLPLFVVTGASGTGKTALAQMAAAEVGDFVHLEMDVLWSPAFNTPEDDYRAFRSAWLRLAKNIGQAGRPVVLYGSVSPAQFENNPERRYFSQLHYLALACQPEMLSTRLLARPDWRGTSSEDFIASMQQFNRWFYDNAEPVTPRLTLLDTTQQSPLQTLVVLRGWLQNLWKPERPV